MRGKDYGNWSAWNESPGGKHNSPDPFNKAFKGAERQFNAKEYAMSGTEEYHHYEATQDTRTMDSDDQQQQQQSDRNNKSDQMKSQARRNLIKQVVGMVAGSTIIVSAYQARVESRSQKQLPAEPPAVVETVPAD